MELSIVQLLGGYLLRLHLLMMMTPCVYYVSSTYFGCFMTRNYPVSYFYCCLLDHTMSPTLLLSGTDNFPIYSLVQTLYSNFMAASPKTGRELPIWAIVNPSGLPQRGTIPT